MCVCACPVFAVPTIRLVFTVTPLHAWACLLQGLDCSRSHGGSHVYVSFGNSLLERLMSLATFIEGYRLARASGLIYTGDLSCKCGSSVISTLHAYAFKHGMAGFLTCAVRHVRSVSSRESFQWADGASPLSSQLLQALHGHNTAIVYGCMQVANS